MIIKTLAIDNNNKDDNDGFIVELKDSVPKMSLFHSM